MIKKLLSVTLCLVLAFIPLLSQSASAFGVSTKLIKTSDNYEYAKKSSEIVYLYNTQNNKNSSDSFGDSLRIIGKTSDMSYNFKQFGAKVCVLGADGRFLLQFNDYDVCKISLKTLNSDSDIVYAEPDGIVSTGSQSGSETEYLSWGVSALGLDKYSEYLSADSSLEEVTVAIVDTGIEKIDFLKDRLVNGYDFVENDSDAFHDASSDSHGTFLAGIVADSTRKTKVNIMPIRVIESENGYMSNAVNGIYYAVDNGADVINISLSGVSVSCSSLDDVLAYAERKNVSVVVCAGNFAMDTSEICPAHLESVITVSSVKENLEFASSFSDFGESVDVCAPGMNIKSYGSDGVLKSMNGTSMSAAFVSAGVALFRMQHPECNAKQAQDALKSNCTDLGKNGFDIYYGHGIPDFSRFVNDKTVYVEGISFSDSNISAQVGDTLPLAPVISPSDATDKSLVWESTDSNIAYINEDNSLVCVSAGRAQITAATVDGGYKASFIVTVKKTISEPVLESIVLKTLPDKTEYRYKSGDSVDLTGIEIEAVYSDGSKVVINEDDGLTCSEISTLSVGKQTVNVFYSDFSVSFEVNVFYAWWQKIIRILMLGFLWY